MVYTTLIDCEALAPHLDDPDWRVFDCRHQLSDVAYGRRAYVEGHLPRAFFYHLDRDLSGPMTGHNGRHPLRNAGLLAGKLGAAGVSRQTQVVVYDDAGGMVSSGGFGGCRAGLGTSVWPSLMGASTSVSGSGVR